MFLFCFFGIKERKGARSNKKWDQINPRKTIIIIRGFMQIMGQEQATVDGSWSYLIC